MKKRNFKIFIITGILMISCNKGIPEATINCLELNESEGITFKGQKKYSGSCFTLYDSNLEKNEIRTYKRGKRHGVWAKYYSNGFLEYKGSYKKEEIHGEYSSFYPDGSIKELGKLNKGYRDGEWILYNEEGKLIRKELHRNKLLINYENF